MKIKKTMLQATFAALGLLTLHPPVVQAQTEQGYARPRDLVALQDDLRLLDDSLYTVPRAHRRKQEFQRRADEIRTDVTKVAEQVRRNDTGRSDITVQRTEVSALRQRIAVLQNDLDGVQTRRRVRGNNNGNTLPVGTEIIVMLEQGVSSDTANPEDRIEASTVSAIMLNGRTVIPAGATVSGVVREVGSNKRAQKDGFLKLEFDSLTPEGGQRMNIRSHVVSIAETSSRDKTLRNGGLGALLGGVVGGIIDGKKGALIGAAVGAGGGLLATKGQDVELPQGTLMTLRLDAPIAMTARR